MKIFRSKDEVPITDDPNWERKLLQKLAMENMREQRRTRRWGIFFKLLLATYLIAVVGISWYNSSAKTVLEDHTAMIDLKGVIGEDGYRKSDEFLSGLKKAFENTHVKGVILRINSPGGSPVQAGYMHDEILRLKKEHPGIPVDVVIGDMCASGGYYVAVAGDKIFADKASIVGSIGVRMGSFGFVDAMQKLGVERRVYSAGAHKTILDPFSPVSPYEKKFAEDMLEVIHQQFINVVKEGRGDKLAKNNPDLFSGLFWPGSEAVGLGLIDGLADPQTVARDEIGAEKIVDYTPQPNLLDAFAGKVGASIGEWIKFNTMGENFTLR